MSAVDRNSLAIGQNTDVFPHDLLVAEARPSVVLALDEEGLRGAASRGDIVTVTAANPCCETTHTGIVTDTVSDEFTDTSFAYFGIHADKSIFSGAV